MSPTGPSGSFTVPDHGDENHFEFELTATDASGLTDTKVVSVQPQTVQVSFASSPSGRLLIYDGAQGTTPFTQDHRARLEHTIEAPEQTGFRFSSWSDGGAQQHNVTVQQQRAPTPPPSPRFRP